MSKKNTLYTTAGLLVALALLLPACDLFKKKEAATEVKQDATVQAPKLLLLDLNTDEVSGDARIPGSTKVSLEKLDEAAATWDKKTPIITYCSGYDCGASHNAAEKLVSLGFEDVSVYEGGTNEWVRKSRESEQNKAKYPVEGDAKMDYLSREVAKTAPREGVKYKTITVEDLSAKLADLKA